ncbi:MAG: 3-hydroxybutyryl-CoA dehydratase [Roseateles depolymerans]|uniref:3-hydroxybutyryl-CoA dehydratase n=1 Tax=Roseateles depolymerans TaxID=76731 RepID=A0A2W5DHE0_9BURK|nr:MAG: 3-hydroxybutyryl-CoA dehydratase [Roseateles depolymerans]
MSADAVAGVPELVVDGALARITLRRPLQANRLSAEDLGVLRQHLEQIDAMPEVRVLVLAGQGRYFCSGFDLSSLGAVDAGAQFGELADALEQVRPVTIARLHGGVYGGASDLALACDFRLGVPTCEMFVPAARIGLHFYGSGLARFVSRLGLGVAKRVLLAGQTLDAAALQQCGFLDELLPDEAALDAALAQLAGRLLAMAPLALLPMKQHLNALAAGRLDAEQLARDIVRARDSADLAEGQRAWAEKRPPRFEGR